MIVVLLAVLVFATAAYLITVPVTFMGDMAWRSFPEYRWLCNGPTWGYFVTPWRPWFSIAAHCWHTTDTYPRCCHCGKGHPDFKEKANGSRKETPSVQGN